jgi:hypothetical protein
MTVALHSVYGRGGSEAGRTDQPRSGIEGNCLGAGEIEPPGARSGLARAGVAYACGVGRRRWSPHCEWSLSMTESAESAGARSDMRSPHLQR